MKNVLVLVHHMQLAIKTYKNFYEHCAPANFKPLHRDSLVAKSIKISGHCTRKVHNCYKVLYKLETFIVGKGTNSIDVNPRNILVVLQKLTRGEGGIS